jgi:hypothetical protein
MAPTDVAKIIVENLGQHEMIDKVYYDFKIIKIIILFYRFNIPDQVLLISLYLQHLYLDKFEIFY